jgi:hypothetical protein
MDEMQPSCRASMRADLQKSVPEERSLRKQIHAWCGAIALESDEPPSSYNRKIFFKFRFAAAERQLISCERKWMDRSIIKC